MVPALPVAADIRTVELFDTSEVRLRGGSGQDTALDLTTIPGASLLWTSHAWQLTLSYEAFLTATSIVPPPVFWAALQTGAAGVSWHSRYFNFALTQSGTYGYENTVNLQITAPTMQGQQAVVGSGSSPFFPFVQSTSTLALTYAPSLRWSFSAVGSYQVYGGLTEVGRAVIPFQQGPVADARLTHAYSHADSVFADASYWMVDTEEGPCRVPGVPLADCAPDGLMGGLTLGLRHAFSHASEGEVAAGASVVRSRVDPSFLYTMGYYPAASATYEYRFGLETRRSLLRLDAHLGPVVDIRSGAVDNRAQASGTLTWFDHLQTVTGSFGAAHSLGDAEETPSTILFVNTELDYHVTRHLTLSAQASYYWQYQEDAAPGTSVISSAILTLLATVSTLPLRF